MNFDWSSAWNAIKEGLLGLVDSFLPGTGKYIKSQLDDIFHGDEKRDMYSMLKQAIAVINKASPEVAAQVEKITNQSTSHSGSLAQQQVNTKELLRAMTKARQAQAKLNNYSNVANYASDQVSAMSRGEITAKTAADQTAKYAKGLGIDLANNYEERI